MATLLPLPTSQQLLIRICDLFGNYALVLAIKNRHDDVLGESERLKWQPSQAEWSEMRYVISELNCVILLKRSLLILWAVWLSVVFLSNLADAGKGLGLLADSWAFASGNLKFIKETTARYGTPGILNALLFAGVILWEGVAALLFWCAAWTFRGKKSGRKQLYLAFTASLLLWGAFLIADEVCIAYALESTHLRLLSAQLLTLLAIELLPED